MGVSVDESSEPESDLDVVGHPLAEGPVETGSIGAVRAKWRASATVEPWTSGLPLLDEHHPTAPNTLVHGDCWQGNSQLVGEDLPAVLDEEGMVVTLVRVRELYAGSSGRPDLFLRVDRADGTHVGLVAGGAGRALVEVHVQQAVAEDRNGLGIRLVGVLDTPAGLDLGEQDIVLGSNS